METNIKTADIEAARKALDDMDDYARMETGVDPKGPREVLERFIALADCQPAASALPDKAAFEAQAKYQGDADLTSAPDATCANGWFPATYRDPATELAWRVWANKPAASAPADKRRTDCPLLIARIKRYRDAFGCTLAEAKDACENGRDLNADQTEFVQPAAPAVGGVEEALKACHAVSRIGMEFAARLTQMATINSDTGHEALLRSDVMVEVCRWREEWSKIEKPDARALLAAAPTTAEATPVVAQAPVASSGGSPAVAPKAGGVDDATLAQVYGAFKIGEQARTPGVLMANIDNVIRFAGMLHAIEREFFMVPGEPDEDELEPLDECMVNSWGSTEAEYVEQFRAALGKLAAAKDGQEDGIKPEQWKEGYSEGFEAAKALFKDKDGQAQAVAWRPSDEDFKEWCRRHDMHNDRSEHRQMFEDAASLYLDAAPPAQQAVAVPVHITMSQVGIGESAHGYVRGWNDCVDAMCTPATSPDGLK